METLEITQEQFLEMVQSRIGYCRACGAKVDEIDANIYNTACPECGEMQVCGVEPLRQLGDIITTPKMIYNGPDILDENGDKIVPVDPSLVGGGMGHDMQEIMEMLSSMQTDPIEDDGNNNNNESEDDDSEDDSEDDDSEDNNESENDSECSEDEIDEFEKDVEKFIEGVTNILGDQSICDAITDTLGDQSIDEEEEKSESLDRDNVSEQF